MATEVKLAQLGQTMEEGTIVSCLVKVGDKVKKGDVIFEIETDKATLEMDSSADGFVKAILVQAGQTVPVGETLMLLGAEDEKVDSAKKASVPEAKNAPAPDKSKHEGASVEAPASVNVVKLAQLGQTMEEGTVVSCLVKVGEKIKRGAVIFEIETDKATLEMDSPAEGTVKAVLAKEGQTLHVGDAMLILADENAVISQDYIDSIKGGKAPAAPAKPAIALEPAAVMQAPVPAAQAPQAPAASQGRVFASPRAKKIAAERGINLAAVKGTGPNGRVVEKDLLAVPSSMAAKQGFAAPKTALPQLPPPAHKLGEKLTVGKFQKITGQKMLQSKTEIPCFYLNSKVDVTQMFKLRSELNQTAPAKISFNDFIIKAVALGLIQFPELTGQLKGEYIQLANEINIGLAIAVGEDLAAPLVRQADQKSLVQIAQYSKALIERAKSGNLNADDVTGGCITVTNLGGFGIDSFIPIVVPGQCSILGVGQIADTCVPVDGNILVRKIMYMTLSVDHKVANGAKAAQFLDYVSKLLENPQALL